MNGAEETKPNGEMPSRTTVHDCSDTKHTAFDRVEKFEKVHFRTTVALQACSFFAFGLMLTVEWISDIRSNEAQWVIDLTLLGKDVIYYDEVLTSSARLYALTSDVAWRDAYFMGIPPLDKALESIQEDAPDIAEDFEAQTVEANGLLIDAETASFDFVLAGDTANATRLLFDEAYTSNKADLLAGVDTLDGDITERRNSYEESQSWWGVLSVIVVSVAFISEVSTTIGLTKLDTRLEVVAEAADAAKDDYNHRVRDSLLKGMQDATAKEGIESTPSEEVHNPDEALRKKKRMKAKIWRVRCYGIFIDLFGVVAVGIPSVLTLMALVNAQDTESLKNIVIHMRMIQYYDLTLTGSAQLCALTGDLQWAERYDTFVAPIEYEINALSELEPDLVEDFVAITTAANNALIDLETVALENCASNPELAQSVMFGDEYAGHKTILLDGIAEMREKVDDLQQEHEESEEQFDIISRILMIVCTLAVVGTDLVRVILAVWVESYVRHHQKVDVDHEEEFMCAVEKLLQKQSERRASSAGFLASTAPQVSQV